MAWQKQKHPALFAEVSIHHLIKNDESCDGFNTYAKLMPPLREEKERLALIEALKRVRLIFLPLPMLQSQYFIKMWRLKMLRLAWVVWKNF